MWDVLTWILKTNGNSYHFLTSNHFLSTCKQAAKSIYQDMLKLNSLWAFLDVADVVAAHRACSHVADECKEFILWRERKQSCIRNRKLWFFFFLHHKSLSTFDILSCLLSCVLLITHCPVRLWHEGPTGGLGRPRSLRPSDRLRTRPSSPCHPGGRRSSPEPDPGRCSVGTHRSLTWHCDETPTNEKLFFSPPPPFIIVSTTCDFKKAKQSIVAKLKQLQWHHCETITQLDCLFQLSRKHSAADDIPATLKCRPQKYVFTPHYWQWPPSSFQTVKLTKCV